MIRCVVEWKEVSSRLMWARVKIERETERERERAKERKRERERFISAYGAGSEKTEEEIEEFWNELSKW